jgi:hypothetical protein
MIFTYLLSGNDEILPSTLAPASSRQFGASRAHRIAINRRDGLGMAHSSNCYN